MNLLVREQEGEIHKQHFLLILDTLLQINDKQGNI